MLLYFICYHHFQCSHLKMASQNKKSHKKLRITKTKRAEITFPVAKIQGTLRNGNYAKHIGTAGSVYCAAVIEYLVAEILELSGVAAKDNNRKRIVPRHITLAVRNDSELDALLSKVTISQGGVLPFINPVLLTKKSKKKSTEVAGSMEH